MKALTQESKARFFAHHMVDGNKFVLNEEAYYDESNPKESMGIGVKSIGFEFTFDWCITPNAFRYGNGVFPFKFIARSAALLTPLSQITDEDAIEVAKMSFRTLPDSYSQKDIIKLGRRLCDSVVSDEASYFSGALCCAINDFLRSKGYALPYLGLSVDEMVSAGWIVLKGGKTDE